MSTSGYSTTQRCVALAYGIVCHATFTLGVAAMAWGLYTGMTAGRGPFTGWGAAVANLMLLLQFPLAHSVLLADRGRKFLARLVPLGIGKELFSTTFAIVSSLQLLLAFAFWSPSGHVWLEFHGAARAACAVFYGASWLLLAKAMNDSDLGLQMGYLGWLAVWNGRAPRYKPFQPTGLFKYSRQPIYVAFTLILWTGPVWTPDHLVLAVGWTLYCLIGPIFKEQRYRRFFGDKFRDYQRQIPYWMPRLRPNHAPPPASRADATDCDVLIVGGGPVGLLLANLLGAEGVRCVVVEKRVGLPAHSMAIGITPPSLQILRRLGLDEEFARRGVAIRHTFVHEAGERLGGVSFEKLSGGYPFMLSLPQSDTIRILRENLRRFPQVRLLEGCEVLRLAPSSSDVAAIIGDGAGERIVAARYVAGCDGHRSVTRELAGIAMGTLDHKVEFAMADFEDRTGFGSDAHLFFGPAGSVESFPLPDRRRRWIVQLLPATRALDDVAAVQQRVFDGAGVDLRSLPALSHSRFAPKRCLCKTYARGRIALCGDAAHTMSPIGGQGMNTGFADAEFLAFALTGIVRDGADATPLLAEYTRIRQRAFRAAAGRAARGMWLGTRTGRLASRLRRALIARLLLNPIIKPRLAPHFAMQTIPFNTLEACGLAPSCPKAP